MEEEFLSKSTEIFRYVMEEPRRLESFAPDKITLDARTKVRILSEQFSKADMVKLTSTWINIRVLTGIHADLEGWIPGFAFDDGFLKRFTLKWGWTGFSGNAYGHYLTNWNGEPHSRALMDLCPQCGCDWTLHTIRETTTIQSPMKRQRGFFSGRLDSYAWTRPNADRTSEQATESPRRVGTEHDAKVLYEALRYIGTGEFEENYFERALSESVIAKLDQASQITSVNAKKGWAANAQTMIGVLHVADSDKVFAAHSGPPRPGFAEVCDALGFISVAALPDLHNLRTRAGDNVAADYKFGSVDDYSCAAPRLIQGAIAANEWPYSMSEIWYDPNLKHKEYLKYHTIESCNWCRDRVVYMLCPDPNL